MSDRYIPRDGPKLDPNDLQPTTPRAKHVVDKLADYLREVKPGQQAVLVAIELWRIFRQHTTCDLGD